MTLAIEEELLQAARAVAAERQTSVSEMVRQYLKQVVGEDRRCQAVRKLLELFRSATSGSGGCRWTREELHDR